MRGCRNFCKGMQREPVQIVQAQVQVEVALAVEDADAKAEEEGEEEGRGMHKKGEQE